VKVYENPETGYGKGPFKRPSSGLDITLDCSKHAASDTTFVEREPEITLDDIDN
jgi:penicillin-binding protein 1A